MSQSHEDVHVQIRRLVIASEVLGTLPRELLREQLSAAIAQRLGGTATRDRLTPLASRIGEVVAPTVTQTIRGRHG
jgi:hypothetical protein